MTNRIAQGALNSYLAQNFRFVGRDMPPCGAGTEENIRILRLNQELIQGLRDDLLETIRNNLFKTKRSVHLMMRNHSDLFHESYNAAVKACGTLTREEINLCAIANNHNHKIFDQVNAELGHRYLPLTHLINRYNNELQSLKVSKVFDIHLPEFLELQSNTDCSDPNSPCGNFFDKIFRAAKQAKNYKNQERILAYAYCFYLLTKGIEKRRAYLIY